MKTTTSTSPAPAAAAAAPRLDAREIEMIILALRFWRAQRGSGVTRRTDSSFVAPDAVDFLIAKLRSQPLASVEAGRRARRAAAVSAATDVSAG
jgi:hypothetical protein